MDDKTLYAELLGLMVPRGVENVKLKLSEDEVHVWMALPAKELRICPDCLDRAPIHDHRDRVWRHLDTFQHMTLLHARVPRLNCPTRGIKQKRVPWADARRARALTRDRRDLLPARAATRPSAEPGRDCPCFAAALDSGG